MTDGRRRAREQDRVAIDQRGRQLPPDSDFRPWPFGRGARLAVAALAGATLLALGLGGLKPAGAKQSAATAGGAFASGKTFRIGVIVTP